MGNNVKLVGTAALFRLRKAAIYLFAAVLIGNGLIAMQIVLLKGWSHISPVALVISLSWPLALCLYAHHLNSKGILN